MSIEEKVDYYYNQMAELRKKYFVISSDCGGIIRNHEKLKKSLEKVINNNYEYLLTPAFLYYVVMTFNDDAYYKKIDDLLKENERIFLVTGYTTTLLKYCGKDYLGRLTENEEHLYYSCIDSINLIMFNPNVSMDQYDIYKIVYQTVFAYVLINNENAEKYIEYAETFKNELQNIFDEMEMHGICTKYSDDAEDGYKYVYKYLVKYIENKIGDNKKEIR